MLILNLLRGYANVNKFGYNPSQLLSPMNNVFFPLFFDYSITLSSEI